jgi:RNA polymerase sigma factor (sigma-70 family)
VGGGVNAWDEGMDWGAIYAETYADVLRFLHRKVWDAERARELTQEVYVRALGHEPENPRAWLFRVAANLARDEAKMVVRRKKHLALLKSEVEAERPPAPDPVEELDRGARLAAVRRALDGLSERDRDALLLWDAGLSYREIAEQTGLAPGAVGTTLARARQRLVESYDAGEGAHVARG